MSAARLSRRAFAAGAGALLCAAAPAQPVNTDGDALGDALDGGDFTAPTLSAVFRQMPAFARGTARPEPPRPLSDPDFQWRAGYLHATHAQGVPDYVPRGRPAPAFSWLSAELATYPNADAIAAGGWSPFSIEHGALVITAERPAPAMRALVPEAFAHDYVSGALISYPFGQTYGYFELRGRVPSGRGLWPAFWLLPVDNQWPPEIDVMEVLGHEPGKVFTTVHSRKLDQGTWIGLGTKLDDLSASDHAYGVDWGPKRLRFYVDRRLVHSEPTPADMHQPFYLLANLAVGGPKSWPGAPDEATRFPARFSISSIQAWQRRAYA